MILQAARPLLALFLAFFAALPTASAGVEEDWAAIVALDAGPPKKPTSREEARLFARAHFQRHRLAVEAFLAKYPSDLRAFDARLRLASLLAAEGKMDENPKKVEEAFQLLAELEKTPGVPQEKRATAGFQRLSLYLQSQRGSTDRSREAVVNAARGFVARYPGDRRGPRLLVEVATVCDDAPTLKRQLLHEAQRLTTEEALKLRIADDLKRLDLLGRPLDLRLTTISGAPLDLASLRGHVVVIIFWSADSPHSLLWLRNFRVLWDKLPKDRLRVITVSLDTDRKLLGEKLAELPASWPTHFDGKGWESPLARSLGINALPTVWILDKKGVLQTLNAQAGYETWIRQLLR
jgi:hypothetical protein